MREREGCRIIRRCGERGALVGANRKFKASVARIPKPRKKGETLRTGGEGAAAAAGDGKFSDVSG